MDAKSDIFVKTLKLMAAYISGFTLVLATAELLAIFPNVMIVTHE